MLARKRFQLAAVAVMAVAAIAGFLLVNTFSSSAAESSREIDILEEGGSINLALWLARKSKGPTLVGDPTAIYGRVMTYRDTTTAPWSSGSSDGPSAAWRLDRTVLVYLFEGKFFDADPRLRDIDDWVQQIHIIDEEKAYPFGHSTRRLAAKSDVSPFLLLSIREDQKDVPRRKIGSFNWPPAVPADPATRAPHPPKE